MDKPGVIDVGIQGWEIVRDPHYLLPHQVRAPERSGRSPTVRTPPAHSRPRDRQRNGLRSPSPVLPSLQLTTRPISNWSILDLDEEFASITPTRTVSNPAAGKSTSDTTSRNSHPNTPQRDGAPRPMINQEVMDILSPTLRYSTETVRQEVIWGELMDIERSVARELSKLSNNGQRTPSSNRRMDVTTRDISEKAGENGNVKREMDSLPSEQNDVHQKSRDSRNDEHTNPRMALMEVFSEERDDTEFTASQIAAEILLSLEKAVALTPNTSDKFHDENSINKFYQPPVTTVAPEPMEEVAEDPPVSELSGLLMKPVQKTTESGAEMETVEETGLQNGEAAEIIQEEKTTVSRNDESIEDVNPAQPLEIAISSNTALRDNPPNQLSEPSATESNVQNTHSTLTTEDIPLPEFETPESSIHPPSPLPQTHSMSQPQPHQPSLILTVSLSSQKLNSLLETPKKDSNATPHKSFIRFTPFATLDESTTSDPGADFVDNDLQEIQAILGPQGSEIGSQGIIGGVDNFGIGGDEEGVCEGISSGVKDCVTLSRDSEHTVDGALVKDTEIESEKELSERDTTHKSVAINREVEEVSMEEVEEDMDDESVDQDGTAMEEVIMDEKQVFTTTQVDQRLAEMSESQQLAEQDIALEEGERHDVEVVHMQIDRAKEQEIPTIDDSQSNAKVPAPQDEISPPSPRLPEHHVNNEMRQQDIEQRLDTDELDDEVSEPTIPNQSPTDTNPPPTLEPSAVDDITSSPHQPTPQNTPNLKNKITTEITAGPSEETVHKTQPSPEDTEIPCTEKVTGHLHRTLQSILSSGISDVSEDEIDEGMITLKLHELQDIAEGEEDVEDIEFGDGDCELEDLRQQSVEIPGSVALEEDEGCSDITDITGENICEESEESIAPRSVSADLTSEMEVPEESAEESEPSVDLTKSLEGSDEDNDEQSKEILPVPSELSCSPSPSHGSKSQKGTSPPLTVPNPRLPTSRTFPNPSIQREVLSTSSLFPSRTISPKPWTAPIPAPELPKRFSHLQASPRSLIVRWKLPRQSSEAWSAPIPPVPSSIPELSIRAAGMEEDLAIGSSPVVSGVKETIQEEPSRSPEISLDDEANGDKIDLSGMDSIDVEETMDVEGSANVSEDQLSEKESDGLVTSTSVSLDGTDTEDPVINRENSATKESMQDEMSSQDLETETDTIMDSDSGPQDPEIAAPNSLASNSMETTAMQDRSISPTNLSLQVPELSPAPTASTPSERQETPPSKGPSGSTLSNLGTQSLSSPRPTPSPFSIVSPGPSVRRQIRISIPILSQSPTRPRLGHIDSTPADHSPTTSFSLSPTHSIATPSFSPSSIPDRRLKFKLKFHEPDTPPLASPAKRRKVSATDNTPQSSPSKPSVLKSKTSKLLRNNISKASPSETTIPQDEMRDCIVVRTDFKNVPAHINFIEHIPKLQTFGRKRVTKK